MIARPCIGAIVTLVVLALGGCGASIPSLSTGSLFGGSSAPPPVVQNDSVSRAMAVSATAARAQKCGYNFDPVKLRGQFLASEAVANPAAAGNLPKVYDTTFKGISKAVADKGADYCTAEKTAQIKVALNRNLAGDYTPPPADPASKEEGLFSGWASNNGGSETPFNTKNGFEN